MAHLAGDDDFNIIDAQTNMKYILKCFMVVNLSFSNKNYSNQL